MFETLEQYFKNLKKLPKNEDLKAKWLKIFVDMAVHTRKRVPKELLLKRRPNEESHIYDYRIENYEPITYGSMNKAFDNLFRIVSGISYTINADENVKEFLKESVFKNVDNGESLNTEMFIQKVALKRMIEDPNGFLVWYPSGEGVTDSAKKVTPKPLLVYSDQYHYSDDKVFIFYSDEKTPLKNTDGDVEMSGEVYWIFTKNEFWKMFQVGTVAKPRWKQEMIYAHDLGRFPVIVLGGDLNAEGFYESFFAPYLAFGNEAIRQFSDWQAMSTQSSHPIKETFVAECEIDLISKLSNNVPQLEEKFQKDIKQGRLKLRNKTASPHSVIERKIVSKQMSEMEAHLPYEFPSVRFIQPDVKNVEYAENAYKGLLTAADESLNVDMTIGVANQSAEGKRLDKEGEYSMATKIGNNIFDNIFLQSLQITDGYLNMIEADNSKASITKPTTFWVKNEDDIVNEITILKEKNAPAFFLAQATMELAKKRFSGNPVAAKMLQFIAMFDPLFIYAPTEKDGMVLMNAINKDDYTKSIFMPTILNQFVMEMGTDKFVQTDVFELKTKFDVAVVPFIPKVATPTFDPNGNQI